MASPPPTDLEIAFINRLRIAVATAVIRCKPSQMTAKQFAESLGQRVRKRQLDWKCRAEKLEAELLTARQKLTAAHLRESWSRLQDENATDWDPEGPESWPDQHGETSSSSVLPELAFPTPPSSIPTDLPPRNTLENHIRINTQFLNCVTGLKSLPGTLEHAASSDPDTQCVVRDTALSGMKTVVNYTSSHLLDERLPWQLVKDALMAVTRTIECRVLATGVREDLVKGMTECIEELFQLIMNDNHLNNHHKQLSSLIVALSSSKSLTPVILRSSLTHIQAVSTMLRRSLTRAASFDPTLYENGAHLLSVVEDTLLPQGTVPSSMHTGVDKSMREVLVEMRDGVERCSLHLSDDFPLFCGRLWQIGSILDWMIDVQIDNVGKKD